MKYAKRVVGFLLSPWMIAIAFMVLWEFIYHDLEAFRKFDSSVYHYWGYIILSYFIWLLVIFGVKYFIIRDYSEFHTDSDLRTAVEDVVMEAEESLYLVSPYLDPGNNLVESILGALRGGAKVKMVFNTHQELKPKVSRDLMRLIEGGVKVYTHPRLHSKLYMNETTVLICSLNLVAASYTESFESGVLTTDPEIYGSARSYIEDRLLSSDQCVVFDASNLPPVQGYCIRSNSKISFDRNHPVEYKQFKAAGGDKTGKYCHSCGELANTSIDAPFCSECDKVYASSASAI